MYFHIIFLIDQDNLYYTSGSKGDAGRAEFLPSALGSNKKAIKELAKNLRQYVYPQSPFRRLKKLRAKILIEMGTDEASKRRIENFFHRMGIFREIHLYDREHKHIGDISREIYLYC